MNREQEKHNETGLTRREFLKLTATLGSGKKQKSSVQVDLGLHWEQEKTQNPVYKLI